MMDYELASPFWRRGLGRCALVAIMDELALNYGVSLFAAVLKSANYRSQALLLKLGFEPASARQTIEFEAVPDELVMVKSGKHRRRTDETMAGGQL